MKLVIKKNNENNDSTHKKDFSSSCQYSTGETTDIAPPEKEDQPYRASRRPVL